MMRKRPVPIILVFLLIIVSGCATVSQPKVTFPTYHLNGTTYLPLVNLCEEFNLDWQWDSISGIVSLKKQNKEIKVLLDSPYILINNNWERISPSPQIFKGNIVVPIRFKEELDSLFRITPVRPKKLITPSISLQRVVIDAGHGGYDPGAIGKLGTREKDIVLDIAKRLSDILESKGIDVVMVRNKDIFVSLEKRCAITNRALADLFISIHANASRQKRVTGFEIYYSKMPQESNVYDYLDYSDVDFLFKNFSMDRKSRVTKSIILDMISTQNYADSINLAKSISNSAAKELKINNRGIKSSRLFVVKNTYIPAILVEVGFISNSKEEQLLRNNFYRQKIAEGISNGILRYADIYLVKE